MNDVKELFTQHEKEDARRFDEGVERDNKMDEKLDKMLTNHLAHMEPDIATIKEAMKWQEKILIGIVTGITGVVVSLLIAIATHTLSL